MSGWSVGDVVWLTPEAELSTTALFGGDWSGPLTVIGVANTHPPVALELERADGAVLLFREDEIARNPPTPSECVCTRYALRWGCQCGGGRAEIERDKEEAQ